MGSPIDGERGAPRTVVLRPRPPTRRRVRAQDEEEAARAYDAAVRRHAAEQGRPVEDVDAHCNFPDFRPAEESLARKARLSSLLMRARTDPSPRGVEARRVLSLHLGKTVAFVGAGRPRPEAAEGEEGEEGISDGLDDGADSPSHFAALARAGRQPALPTAGPAAFGALLPDAHTRPFATGFLGPASLQPAPLFPANDGPGYGQRSLPSVPSSGVLTHGPTALFAPGPSSSSHTGFFASASSAPSAVAPGTFPVSCHVSTALDASSRLGLARGSEDTEASSSFPHPWGRPDAAYARALSTALGNAGAGSFGPTAPGSDGTFPAPPLPTAHRSLLGPEDASTAGVRSLAVPGFFLPPLVIQPHAALATESPPSFAADAPPGSHLPIYARAAFGSAAPQGDLPILHSYAAGPTVSASSARTHAGRSSDSGFPAPPDGFSPATFPSVSSFPSPHGWSQVSAPGARSGASAAPTEPASALPAPLGPTFRASSHSSSDEGTVPSLSSAPSFSSPSVPSFAASASSSQTPASTPTAHAGPHGAPSFIAGRDSACDSACSKRRAVSSMEELFQQWVAHLAQAPDGVWAPVLHPSPSAGETACAEAVANGRTERAESRDERRSGAMASCERATALEGNGDRLVGGSSSRKRLREAEGAADEGGLKER